MSNPTKNLAQFSNSDKRLIRKCSDHLITSSFPRVASQLPQSLVGHGKQTLRAKPSLYTARNLVLHTNGSFPTAVSPFGLCWWNTCLATSFISSHAIISLFSPVPTPRAHPFLSPGWLQTLESVPHTRQPLPSGPPPHLCSCSPSTPDAS